MDYTSDTDDQIPLILKKLTVAYQDSPALWNVSFITPTQKLTAIIGPNGAGKSTLIKAILGLVPIVSGEIRVFGKKPKHALNRIAYVPQRNTVDWDFPASAVDVVAMGLYGKIGWCRPVRHRHIKIARKYLQQVEMDDLADRQIGQLSGGQQQRVFLARALAQSADLYLMDEPFSGVDAYTEQTILQVMQNVKENGATVICVHHDLKTIEKYFDYALMLNVQQIKFGSVNKVLTDENLRNTYGPQPAIT
tara:strand:+ start:2677 stop:3423 length:747 start_codon:yes stop_codon:yes gene_type:complete